jgi:tRNA(Ile2) C34 agmatinyltransferase TiaS
MINYSSEDTQCFVDCVCGETISVSHYKIFRCKKCGRGYRTEFIVWEYAPNNSVPENWLEVTADLEHKIGGIS